MLRLIPPCRLVGALLDASGLTGKQLLAAPALEDTFRAACERARSELEDAHRIVALALHDIIARLSAFGHQK